MRYSVMGYLLLAGVAWLAACTEFRPGLPATAGSCDDWSFAPSHFDPCSLDETKDVGPALVLDKQGTYVLDTDDDTLTDPDGMPGAITRQHRQSPDQPEFELVVVERLEIADEAILRIEGVRPVLIASWGDISMKGVIDVSSGKNMQMKPGAGADPQSCQNTAATAGSDGQEGGGGGGGGGFGSKGGDGGTTVDGIPAGTGGKGGTPLATVTALRGGCSGAKGGKNQDLLDGGGAGGRGGGAIALVARGTITIAGRIDAAGEGGRASNPDVGGNDASSSSGGGGGGSGGLILLEGNKVDLQPDVILAANGGGGGGGCNNNAGQPGSNGLLDKLKAAGGVGEGGRSNGGDGGFLDVPEGQMGASDDLSRGGGGGGGGVGFVRFRSPSVVAINPGATLSPQASVILIEK